MENTYNGREYVHAVVNCENRLLGFIRRLWPKNARLETVIARMKNDLPTGCKLYGQGFVFVPANPEREPAYPFRNVKAREHLRYWSLGKFKGKTRNKRMGL